jgi:hypothetical protein
MAEAPARYCSNCGHELNQDDRFCPNCGTPVHQAAHVPTPEADVPVPPPPQAGGAGTAAPRERGTRDWLVILGAVVWVIALAGALASGSGSGFILVLIIGIGALVAFTRGAYPGVSAKDVRQSYRQDESGRLVLRDGFDAPISEAERSRILDEEIGEYMREGFFVRQRTASTAQLVRPKKFSFIWALVWFLMLGVGLVVYLLYYAAKQDEGRYVEVDEYGTVRATRQVRPVRI